MTQAAHLIKENCLLKQKIEQQEQFIEAKNHCIDEQANEITRLKEMIALFQQQRFGSSSEKVSPDQLGLFNEAESIKDEESASDGDTESNEDTDTITVPSHTRKRRPRVSIPDSLPCEDIIHDLPDDEKVCPKDGTELKAIGYEDHKQLEIIPASVKAIRHRRVKYICPCCEEHNATAKKTAQPIEKSIASPSLLAYIAISKFCDALPLYRQSQIFERFGIELDRSNLANWMVRCGELIQPLINLMLEHLEQQPVIHMDETTLQVLQEAGKTPQSKSYMWVMATDCSQPVIIYQYYATRAQSVPLELLNENYQAIMVDGYEGYQKACNTYGIARLGCMQHARRRFVDAKKLVKKGKTGRADQALAFMQKLYRIENQIKEKPPDERYRIRQQDAKPIIDKMHQWLEKNLPHVLPSSTLGKAMHYLHNQWDRLVRYLDDGHYPIDNNYAENKIRPYAVGRKNWLFANSMSGAKSSANLYSLIQTAKVNNVDLFAYLTHVFKELPQATSLEDIELLLPWNYKATIENS